MKPSFALNLSLDGISLLHRAGSVWVNVGDVSIDSEDLAAELSMLRKSAANLSPAGITSKLVLPNSQILYASLEDPGEDDAKRHAAIQKALDGTTPYTLDEITYDWRIKDGQILVAAVANETLEEAEAFASEHRFNPVSFVAVPENGDFPGEPFFGQAKATAELLPEGETVERDCAQPDAPGPADLNIDDTVPDEPDGQGALGDAPGDAPQPSEPSPSDSLPPAQTATQFVSRRDASAPQPPAPRISQSISQTPARIDLGTGAAALGGVSRKVETTHVPITAPFVGDQDDTPPPKKAPKAKKSSAPKGMLPEPPPMPLQRTPIAPLEPTEVRASESISSNDGTNHAAPTAEHPQEAEALTVFGARKADGAAQRRGPKYLGLILTGILLVCLAVIFVVSGWMSDDEAGAQSEQGAAQTGAAAPLPTDDRQVAAEQPPEPAPEIAPPPALPSQGTAAVPDAATLARQQGDVELDPTLDPAAAAPGTRGEAQNTPADVVADTMVAREPRLSAQTSASTELAIVPTLDSLDDVFIAAIDPRISDGDAVALPLQRGADGPPAQPSTPASPTAKYDLDENGLVRATRQGAPTPQGAIVFLGRPDRVPAPRPDAAIAARAQDIQESDALAAGEAVAETEPSVQPSDLIERQDTSATGGNAMAELAQILPQPRPADLAERAAQIAAKRAAAEASAQAAAAAAQAASAASLAAEEPPQTAQPIRITSGLAAARPTARPQNFAAIVERARANSQATGATSGTGNSRALLAAATPRAPSIPTAASVARQATSRNAINLNRLNLIGVYGSNQERRALVRLPSGKYEKVKVGDRLDGGRVRAIGKDDLTYTKNGRNMTLEIKG